MEYSKELVAGKLKRWERFLSGYHLPRWDELPILELYMDQIIILLTQYLSFMPREENEDKLITASIINNYVRMRIMPPPVKKKYARVHMAYLIMICSLKQSLNIAYVQKMIPVGISEEEVAAIYNDFVEKHDKVSQIFIQHIKEAAMDVLDSGNIDENAVSSMVVETAITANLFKILTEKIVNLQIPRANPVGEKTAE